MAVPVMADDVCFNLVHARELIRTVLLDLAGADGERSAEETRILQRIDTVWPR